MPQGGRRNEFWRAQFTPEQSAMLEEAALSTQRWPTESFRAVTGFTRIHERWKSNDVKYETCMVFIAPSYCVVMVMALLGSYMPAHNPWKPLQDGSHTLWINHRLTETKLRTCLLWECVSRQPGFPQTLQFISDRGIQTSADEDNQIISTWDPQHEWPPFRWNVDEWCCQTARLSNLTLVMCID